MKKPTRLTDAEKFQAFNYICENASGVECLTAAELAFHLSVQLQRDITPEIARHQAKVCGVQLKGTKKSQDNRDIFDAIYNCLATISHNDPSPILEERVRNLRTLLDR